MNWLAGADAGALLGWLGLDDASGTIPGQGIEGVAIFALDIENGYTIVLRYPTNVIKAAGGKEQRRSRNDRPKESYRGSALLLGDSPVLIRTTMAEHAAAGHVFALGLPHEELFLRADAQGTTVFVRASELALADAKNPGQRVVLVRENEDDEIEAVEAVIQSTTADSITLDRDPGNAGLYGGRIMPLKPILLEPQQDFERYPVEVERWKIAARAADFDFARSLATLDLGPITVAPGLDLASVTERVPGSSPSFTIDGDAIAGVILEETATGVIAHCNLTGAPIVGGAVTQLYDALLGSTLVAPTGTWGVGTLHAGDEVPLTQLTGGELAGPIGEGATITEYAGHPLWDREIIINETITDGVHAMTEIVDHDGVPYSVALADYADWYRQVNWESQFRSELQWLKLFLATVRGCQKVFWLSTWRDDLPCVAAVGSTITVEGNVGVWWPRQRQHVQILDESDGLTQAEVTAAVNNGDGTWTLTLDAVPAGEIVMVSWLELSRFEKPDFSVNFGSRGFSLSTIARVVQQ